MYASVWENDSKYFFKFLKRTAVIIQYYSCISMFIKNKYYIRKDVNKLKKKKKFPEKNNHKIKFWKLESVLPTTKLRTVTIRTRILSGKNENILFFIKHDWVQEGKSASLKVLNRKSIILCIFFVRKCIP